MQTFRDLMLTILAICSVAITFFVGTVWHDLYYIHAHKLYEYLATTPASEL